LRCYAKKRGNTLDNVRHYIYNSIIIKADRGKMNMIKNDDVSVSFRIDRDLKEKAVKLFGELGLNMSSAIQVFFRQAVREGGLPFDVTTKVPSKLTLAAMLEAERIAQDPGHPAYSDIQDLLDALNS